MQARELCLGDLTQKAKNPLVPSSHMRQHGPIKGRKPELKGSGSQCCRTDATILHTLRNVYNLRRFTSHPVYSFFYAPLVNAQAYACPLQVVKFVQVSQALQAQSRHTHAPRGFVASSGHCEVFLSLLAYL
jgi:hypothetical protein